MEFLNEDFAKEHEIKEEVLTAIKAKADDYLAEQKKAWDSKANDNAEKIIDGAAKYAREKTGVAIEREKGEKMGDYLQRIADTSLSKAKEDLDNKQRELDEKLKNFKGGDEYKAQLEKISGELDQYKKRVAELEPLEGLDQKYEEATQTLSKMKIDVAFSNIKPTFPQEANEWEVKGKWNQFKNGVLEKYVIELVDGEAIAIDKDNEHKRKNLADLLKEDEDIQGLLEGRQQRGTGATPKDLVQIEGLPIKLPKDASREEISTLLRQHLTEKYGSVTDPRYAKEFAELYAKATQAKAA